MSQDSKSHIDDRILVITVCYRSLETMREWYRLRSTENIQVVLVDNSNEPGLDTFAAEIGAELIVSPTNVGFGRGCNLGLTRCSGERWVAFVNPDASVTANQLQSLVADAPSETVARSPLLVNTDGLPHGDMFRRFPTPLSTVATWLMGSRSRFARRNFINAHITDKPIAVEVTSGSCVLARTEAVQSIGGFPPWMFLNGEDIFFFHELRRFGRIEVDPRVHVAHQKLSSATVVPIAAIRAETARGSASYTLKVHGFGAWLFVAFASVAGYSMRYLTTPTHLSLVPRLIATEAKEAWALMRGRDLQAGPIFVPRLG